jgi:hypothetical protein
MHPTILDEAPHLTFTIKQREKLIRNRFSGDTGMPADTSLERHPHAENSAET